MTEYEDFIATLALYMAGQLTLVTLALNDPSPGSPAKRHVLNRLDHEMIPELERMRDRLEQMRLNSHVQITASVPTT